MFSTGQNVVKKSNESKKELHIAEAVITENEFNSYFRPKYPTVKDTVQIKNKKNSRLMIPTINETVLIDKPYSNVSLKPNECLKKTINTSIENQMFNKNPNIVETRLYMEKKKKEISEKQKLDILEKKRLAEERKIRLDNLQKTTKELAKASIKQKTPYVQEKHKDIINLPTESNKPGEVDQTFRLSPKVKSIKKTPMNISKKCIKNLDTIYDDNEFLKMTNNIKDTSTFSKISKTTNTIPQKKIVIIELPLRDVTKPEDLFSKLKINDNYKLIDNSLFDFLMPKTVNIDTSLAQKDHKEKLVEEEDEKQTKTDFVDMSNINSQLIDTKMYTNLNLSKCSHEEIIKIIKELRELLINQCLPSKNYYSESTQTDDCNNLLSLFSLKKSPPPMNFISVLKCKNKLQLRQNDFNTSEPIENLNINDYSISNNLPTDKISNINNVEPTVQNLVDYEKMENLPNLFDKEQENYCNKNNSTLIKETIVPEFNDLTLNEALDNNFCEEITKYTLNNDKLFTKSKNILINEDISKNTNDLHNTCMYLKFDENNSMLKSSSRFPEIHDEFQAELETINQLNNSLCDIEKMSCDISIKSNEQFVDNEFGNNSTSNSLSFKSFLNKPTPLSKLNTIFSNTMCVDKTITGFSIQMFEQLIKDEELRAKQHHTIVLLREKSLTNRLKWEITMCDLQTRHLKSRPGYEKQLQSLKQKHRGEVKKLEHSLHQVKRLGREIDSFYTRRLIILKEHIQHLKMQSSSKKVIRKLKNFKLDQIPKKEEFQSLNSNFFKQYDNTNIDDTVESEYDNINPNELIITSKNNKISPTMFKVDKSKITLRNQATSPINTDTKPVENAKIQTDIKGSLPFTENKCVQTSKSFSHVVSNNNTKSIDLSYKYKSPVESINVDKTSLLSNSSTSHVELMQTSESSISTISEQTDMNVRISTLQYQLEARKFESFRLKKERKKLRLENLKNLKAKEQDLLKQIDLYDKKIEESKKSLIVEIERKSIQLKKFSIKLDSSKYCCKNNPALEENNQNLHDSYRKIQIAMEKLNNQCIISQENPSYKLQQTIAIKSKQNSNEFESNCDSMQIDHCNLGNQSLESNQSCDVITLDKESTEREVNTLKESSAIKAEVNNLLLKPHSVETLIYISNDQEGNIKKITHASELNEISAINLEPLCNNCLPNQEILNTFNNQEFNFEGKINIEKTTISNDSKSNYHTISSNSNNIQRKLFVGSDNDGNNVREENENLVNQLEILNSEIEVDDNYSTEFMSDDNTSKFQVSYQFSKDDTIEFLDEEQSNESSYEEERSEGDVVFEDKTFIEQYSHNSNFVHHGKYVEEEVNVITNNIFNCLVNDMKKKLKSDLNRPLFFSEKNNLNNLTEETPLLMNLKREEKHQNMIFLFEQATTISDVLFKSHLHPLLSEILEKYLSKLNEIQREKLSIYLNWLSDRKQLRLSEYLNFQHKSSDVGNDESFEMFYQQYKNQKKYPTIRNESNNEMLNQTQQETEKLKLEQMRIEKEIKRLRVFEKSNLFLQKIPNEPPPPYKSPTKKEAPVDVSYTPDEICKIVFTAASQLFNDFQKPMSEDYILDSDSSLHADYKTLIFDYCKEIAQNTFIDDNHLPIWKRHIKKLKHFRAKPKCPKDLSDVIMKQINQIIDTDVCEERVNKFIVKQLHEEDSKWIDIRMDAMDVQEDIIQNLMKKLICDTITNIEKNFYLKFIV